VSKTKSKTYQKIKPIRNVILKGNLLCIDPSTGSKSSNPGYAWFENGKLIESGEIIVDVTGNRNERLYEIARCIREDFAVPDVLIVEYIPPMTYKGRTNQMNTVSLMALQKAIGAIIGAVKVKHLLEIPAASWRAWKPDNYVKTDEMDAICLGLCAIGLARLEKDD